MTSLTETREAVARTIYETNRTWVNSGNLADAIIADHLAPLHAEIESLRADAERSEKHRNDLMDTIVSLRTERGALRARAEDLAGVIDGTDPSAGNPSKWGLRALLDGACSQRDTALSEVSRLTAALAESERQGAVMRERAAKVCDEAAAYFDRTTGHYDRSQAARSYRHSASLIRQMPSHPRALTLKEPTHEH